MLLYDVQLQILIICHKLISLFGDITKNVKNSGNKFRNKNNNKIKI